MVSPIAQMARMSYLPFVGKWKYFKIKEFHNNNEKHFLYAWAKMPTITYPRTRTRLHKIWPTFLKKNNSIDHFTLNLLKMHKRETRNNVVKKQAKSISIFVPRLKCRRAYFLRCKTFMKVGRGRKLQNFLLPLSPLSNFLCEFRNKEEQPWK